MRQSPSPRKPGQGVQPGRHHPRVDGSSPLIQDDELTRRVNPGLLQVPDGADDVLWVHVAGGVIIITNDKQSRVATASGPDELVKLTKIVAVSGKSYQSV